jgi:hypothetical protein
MNKLLTIKLFALIFGSTIFTLRAAEGMWLPVLIEKFNIDVMHENGFKLTADDIYNINNASMKDGVMIFGGGCTAELISPEGLILTNHHCGFSQIQKHSSVQNDYLTNGFWATNRSEELSNSGLSVTFLKYMRDVSSDVLNGINDKITEAERKRIIKQKSDSIIYNAIKNTHFKAEVESFYEGNQYFLFVNEVFTDVRLVGAPPSAVGGFGGDTDNWVWPRHSGDFSLFRIYADANNLPKDYSDDNVPYSAPYFFPISIKGVTPNDFTMVFGYPGSTNQYCPSNHIEMLVNTLYPALIDVRTQKLDIIHHYSNLNPEYRIKYAAKEASVSNAWKKWQGEIKGLTRFEVIEKKKELEKGILQKYNTEQDVAGMFDKYNELYHQLTQVNVSYMLLREVFLSNGAECFTIANKMGNHVISTTKKGNNLDKALIASTYKDYSAEVDKALTEKLLAVILSHLEPKYIPATLLKIAEKEKNNTHNITTRLFEKTLFSDSGFVHANMGKHLNKKIGKDPCYLIFDEVLDIYYKNLMPAVNSIQLQIDSLNRIFTKLQMDFAQDKVLFPNANSTLRLTYGKVEGYRPRDGVVYDYITTHEGILEKDNPDIYDYNVPDKLRTLLTEGNFGPYALPDGRLPVCFAASNHTTGGNSGSPVLNAEGHLVGINFDRAWDGVMSDLYYNEAICRNISVDIRYVLFIIDKFAGAGYLLDEMKIIR